jgi:hypothetical protein
LPTKVVSTVDTCTTTNPIAISGKRTNPMVSSKNDAPVTSPGVSAADAADNEEAADKEAADGADQEEDEVVVDTALR